MSTLYETTDVMQTLEDAFVAEIRSVFPSHKIYTNPMSQSIPDKCVVLILQVMNMGRDLHSDATRRRTVQFDIAVVDKGMSPYDVDNKLMEINSIKFGEITKVLTSGRFSRVEGIPHMSGYFYVTEIIN